MPEIEHLGRFKIVLFLLISLNIYGQTYPVKKVDWLLRKGIDNIINQKYAEAETTFTQLSTQYKNIPLGNIYLAAAEIAKSFDYTEDFDEDQIETNLDKAEDIANSLIDKDDYNVWNIYFLALTQGYRAYYNALKENWLSAFDNGFNSVSNFEKCLDIDSTFFEAYAALGTYIYWKSRKTESLDWLPFVKDNKPEGISYLIKAVNKSSYNSYLAVNSLQWIYIDQKEYKKAIVLSDSIIAKYPHSRFFKWGLARSYEDVDKSKSISIYNEILNSYNNLSNINEINKITLKHLIAQQYDQIGEVGSALKLCNEILNTNLSDFEKSKLRKRLERVRNLRQELLARLNSSK